MCIGEVRNEFRCAVSDNVKQSLKINNLPELCSQSELDIAAYQPPMPSAFVRALPRLLPGHLVFCKSMPGKLSRFSL